MKDLNTMLLTGRIVDEPEMRFTGEGELFTTLIVASAPARAQAEALHVRLVAWGESLAERCNTLTPGTRIFAEGRLTACTAEEADVRARFPLEVRLREVIVIGQGDAAPAIGATPAAVSAPPPPLPTVPTPPRPAAARPAASAPPRPSAPSVPRRPTAPASPATPPTHPPARPPRPMLEEVDLPL
ncbi:MAG: single-stranded DNA-binding protein [Chloroflexales bacterium]